MKNIVFLLFIFTGLLFSCSDKDSNADFTASKSADYGYEKATEETTEAVDETSVVEAEQSTNATSSTPIKVTERKIIKEGSISFETDNITDARKKIDKVVKELGAYVSADTENKYPEKIQQNMTIRVPIADFDNLLNKIVSGAEHLDSKDINATDVTEEFLDIQARIKTKKELEARYLQILTKANSVSDIMEVERQIGVLREEIESAEGRLKFLENRTSLSTLHVTFYEYHESEKGFGSEFSRGFVNGWTNMVWFLVGLVNIWPFLIFMAGIIWFIINRINKRKANKAKI